MAVMEPLFKEHDTTIRCDDVIFATQEQGASRFPDLAFLIAQEEATSDLLMEELAYAEIFGVRCAPVRLGPRYPHRQVLLLSFPELRPSDEMHDPDDLVLLMWEEFPPHRQ